MEDEAQMKNLNISNFFLFLLFHTVLFPSFRIKSNRRSMLLFVMLQKIQYPRDSVFQLVAVNFLY